MGSVVRSGQAGKVPTAQEQCNIQMEMSEPVPFAASSSPAIMYLHKAMKASDKKQFLIAMDNEIIAHEKGQH